MPTDGRRGPCPGTQWCSGVARAASVSDITVRKGVFELEAGEEPLGRVRRPGGGRKRVADLDPGLRPVLLALVEPDERGDPMSPLRWTVKSTRTLARTRHKVGADIVADLLREEGFSLHPAEGQETTQGAQHHPAGGPPPSALTTLQVRIQALSGGPSCMIKKTC